MRASLSSVNGECFSFISWSIGLVFYGSFHQTEQNKKKRPYISSLVK